MRRLPFAGHDSVSPCKVLYVIQLQLDEYVVECTACNIRTVAVPKTQLIRPDDVPPGPDANNGLKPLRVMVTIAPADRHTLVYEPDTT